MTQADFDCNSTTPVYPKAAQAALACMQESYGNPSSSHQFGIRARLILESTRKTTAKVVGAESEQILFTSGATEAIHAAVFSTLQFWKNHPNLPKYPKILYAATEHKAVSESIDHWVKALELPYEVVSLPVDPKGQVQLDFLKQNLADAILICTMAVNNETGVIQRLDLIERLLIEQKSAALWLVDSVQALGKVRLQLNATRIDYAAFSGHKLYAPKGTGFLYTKNPKTFSPLITGGGQENGHRSGTQNIPGIAALKVVFDDLLPSIQPSSSRSADPLYEYRGQILESLKEAFPQLVVNTPLNSSIPTTLNVAIPGLKSSELLDVFDAAGLRVSAGSACSAKSPEPSHVLKAMGVPEATSMSAIRFSFGHLTTRREVRLACQLIRKSGHSLVKSGLLSCAQSLKTKHPALNGILQLRSQTVSAWLIVNPIAKTCMIIDPIEALHERITQLVRSHALKVIAILSTQPRKVRDSDSGKRLIPLTHALKQIHAYTIPKCDSLGWPEASPFLTRVRLIDGQEAEALQWTEGGAKPTRTGLVCARIKTSENTAYILGHLSNDSTLQAQFSFCSDWNFSKLTAAISADTLICCSDGSSHPFARTLRAAKQTAQPRSLTSMTVTSATLEQFLATRSSKTLRVIDVRESYEFAVCSTWKRMKLKQQPENIPLSRLVSFMDELISKKGYKPRILFVCRSGNRSLQATQALRAIGYEQTWTLEGGLALLSKTFRNQLSTP